MDFILFLLFAGAAFYFSKTHSHTQQKEQQSTPNLPVKTIATTQSERPPIPPLLGIEITAVQRRRLGKDDPSIHATSHIQTSAAHAKPSFFKDMSQHIQKTLQEMQQAFEEQNKKNNAYRKNELNDDLNDVFSKKK